MQTIRREIRSADTSAILALIASIKEAGSKTRREFIEKIIKNGESDVRAISALSAEVQDMDEDVLLIAVWALAAMGEAIAPTLIAALDDEDEGMRAIAAYVLGEGRNRRPSASSTSRTPSA